MKSFLSSLWALLILTLPAYAVGLTDFSQVQIKTVPVQGPVKMLTGQGGNIGASIGEDGILLIDDQFAPLIPKIERALKTLSAKPIRFVINTHWHPDHTGGNEPLGKGGSVIIAQENVRQRLSEKQWNQFLKRATPPAPSAALPVITFPKEITFYFNGDEIKVFHVPSAHTDGDSIIYFKKSNVVHTGDTYVAGMYPFIDSGSGGSIDGLIAAADQILKTIPVNAKVIPGHGPLSNMEELKSYRQMLVTVRDRVSKLKKAGKSAPDVVAAKPTADFDATWGKGWIKPDAFVEMVYFSLK